MPGRRRRWRLRLLRDAVQPVARVAEPGHDVALLVELLVHRGGDDGDRDVQTFEVPLEPGAALGGGQQADRSDVVGAVAGVIMLSSFLVPGGPAAAGWTGYATLSARAAYTGVDLGQDLWIISLLVLGISSLMGSINYITTIVNMRAPGMSYFRMPLTVWSLFITAILLLLALPVLTAALAMLLAA